MIKELIAGTAKCSGCGKVAYPLAYSDRVKLATSGHVCPIPPTGVAFTNTNGTGDCVPVWTHACNDCGWFLYAPNPCKHGAFGPCDVCKTF